MAEPLGLARAITPSAPFTEPLPLFKAVGTLPLPLSMQREVALLPWQQLPNPLIEGQSYSHCQATMKPERLVRGKVGRCGAWLSQIHRASRGPPVPIPDHVPNCAPLPPPLPLHTGPGCPLRDASLSHSRVWQGGIPLSECWVMVRRRAGHFLFNRPKYTGIL